MRISPFLQPITNFLLLVKVNRSFSCSVDKCLADSSPQLRCHPNPSYLMGPSVFCRWCHFLVFVWGRGELIDRRLDSDGQEERDEQIIRFLLKPHSPTYTLLFHICMVSTASAKVPLCTWLNVNCKVDAQESNSKLLDDHWNTKSLFKVSLWKVKNKELSLKLLFCFYWFILSPSTPLAL